MSATPRIYVACLASYNAGRLHGEWIDADQSADDLWSDIAAMLAASPENRTCQWCGAELSDGPDSQHWDRPCTHSAHWPGHAEEWAIHDYEGFHPLRLGEYESIERVAAIAQGLREHGEAFAAWLSDDSSREPSDVEAFEDSYLGEWDSMRDYAENYADDVGMDALAEATGCAYIRVDIDALETDLEIELSAVESGHYTVYVFNPS